MNLSRPLSIASRFWHSVTRGLRKHAFSLLPKKRCYAFGTQVQEPAIDQIYVINLDRQPSRWADTLLELSWILDATGAPLADRAKRFPARDALNSAHDVLESENIHPFYTLGDQLYVEPQPDALPDNFDLIRPIRMSPAEVAVAGSHIGVWKALAQSRSRYALVVEDDVCFERRFADIMNQAWREMKQSDGGVPDFDLLYVSYAEVRHGAPKELLSNNVFRPERGLWFLSGYVLSRKGAQALLRLLPCRGPVDLWINHKFGEIDVRALRRSVVNQRLDTPSTNSYSILPELTRIGVLSDGSAALYHQRPAHAPVFAFGPRKSGLSSLAMALSMLGYRCCSDLDRIPDSELESLLSNRGDAVFNAYVNIASLIPRVPALLRRYPQAKFIILDGEPAGDNFTLEVRDALKAADIAFLRGNEAKAWGALCEHLRVPPPATPYPVLAELGLRKLRPTAGIDLLTKSAKRLRHDHSPWIIERNAERWPGINATHGEEEHLVRPTRFEDPLADHSLRHWWVRNDTFPGNLALFRIANVSAHHGGGLSLAIKQESLGVREFSAAAISSRDRFMYGRFEATLCALAVPGVVTGFFLHRNSPRQEIDIEITGNRPDRILVNVFYNPGGEGAKFDYGYRGTPVAIPLGFDASQDFHRFAIEWTPSEILWFVDDKLIHRRTSWNPTPIPHLPMTVHVNAWPTRSRELAGRLVRRALPASVTLRRIAIDAMNVDAKVGDSLAADTLQEV